MSYYIQKPWYIFAPHLLFPLRNGADVYIEGVAKGLSSIFQKEKIILVGANGIYTYVNGKIIQKKPFENKLRSKLLAALRTLTLQSSYQAERFITKRYLKEIQKLKLEDQANIIYSFNSSILLAEHINAKEPVEIVLTHNFDPYFFRELANNSKSYVTRKVFGITISFTINLLKKFESRFCFTHINKADLSKYQKLFPAMSNHILLAGISNSKMEKILPEKLNIKNGVKICFCGGLSSIQNQQALEYFGYRFWPVMKQYFVDEVTFNVIGSSPTSAIAELCRRNQWNLKADVSDEYLQQLVSGSHFSILPFEHSSGSKMKLLESLGHGTPFLATKCIQDQLLDFPENSLFSDDPIVWCEHLSKWKESVITVSAIQQSLDYANLFSWPSVCSAFVQSFHNKVA